jgi:hypothetical protein
MIRVTAVKFALLLVIVLLAGQLQCASACVSFFSAQAANQSLPPCHRHHDSKVPGDVSDVCSHEIGGPGIVAQPVSAPVPTLAAQFAPVVIAMNLRPVDASFLDAAAAFAAPPGTVAPTILRI